MTGERPLPGTVVCPCARRSRSLMAASPPNRTRLLWWLLIPVAAGLVLFAARTVAERRADEAAMSAELLSPFEASDAPPAIEPPEPPMEGPPRAADADSARPGTPAAPGEPGDEDRVAREQVDPARGPFAHEAPGQHAHRVDARVARHAHDVECRGRTLLERLLEEVAQPVAPGEHREAPGR